MTRLGSTLNAMFPAFYLISPSSVVSLSHPIHALCHLQLHSPFSVPLAYLCFVFVRCPCSTVNIISFVSAVPLCGAVSCCPCSFLCDNIFARIKALAARACACAPACELSVTVPAPLPVNRILDADNNEIMSAKETYFL